MPVASHLAGWYSADYFDRYYGGDRTSAVQRCGAFLQRAGALLGRSPATLLDVGCGVGDLGVAARDKGWNVTGLETAPAAADRARARGIQVVQGDAAALLAGRSANGSGLGEERFDVVVFRDSLAHLADAGQALVGAVRRLRSAGWLAVRTPNRHPGLLGTARWVARLTDASGILHLPAQVVHLDRRSLRICLERQGLVDIEVEGDTEAVAETGGRYSRGRVRNLLWRRAVARWSRQGEPEALWGWGRKR